MQNLCFKNIETLSVIFESVEKDECIHLFFESGSNFGTAGA